MSTTPPKTTKKDEEQTQHIYNIGDIVLGKLRGYPPWPGQVGRSTVLNSTYAHRPQTRLVSPLSSYSRVSPQLSTRPSFLTLRRVLGNGP